jgi:hypothetical protein
MTAFSRMLPNISAGLRAPADATTLGLPVTLIEPITFQFRSSSPFLEVFDIEGRARRHPRGGGQRSRVRRASSTRWPFGTEKAASSRVGVMYVVVVEKR